MRTFEQLAADAKCTPGERRALAWRLGEIRMRKTVEALADSGKRCFTYCGDGRCTCGADPASELFRETRAAESREEVTALKSSHPNTRTGGGGDA